MDWFLYDNGLRHERTNQKGKSAEAVIESFSNKT